MNLNDFIVNVFRETDDFMKKFFPHRTLRTRGPIPQLADSEALTMGIVGEFLGLDTDKAIFGFFKRFYRHISRPFARSCLEIRRQYCRLGRQWLWSGRLTCRKRLCRHSNRWVSQSCLTCRWTDSGRSPLIDLRDHRQS